MIFSEQISRKPDYYPWAQDYINAMWQGHWTANEFSFQSDIQNYKTELTPQEQNIVKNTLSAIGQIEIAVKKFWAKLGDNLPHPSLSDLGYCMANVEVIHNIAYEKLLKCMDLEQVFEENLKLDIIMGRVSYLKKYLDKNYEDDKKQYVYALTLFTLFVENVSLFSQFYIILWFNRFNNVLKDTAQQVQYTFAEENIHALVGIKLINTIKEEYPELFDEELENKIKEEAINAFNAESKIIDWMLCGFNEESLNSNVLKEYVKDRINKSLAEIGYSKVFETDEKILKNCQWMEEETLANTMTDFFQKRPTSYMKNGAVYSEEELF